MEPEKNFSPDPPALLILVRRYGECGKTLCSPCQPDMGKKETSEYIIRNYTYWLGRRAPSLKRWVRLWCLELDQSAQDEVGKHVSRLSAHCSHHVEIDAILSL